MNLGQPLEKPEPPKIEDISLEQDPTLTEKELCVVCAHNKRAGVFYKCGHNCCCHSCGLSFIGKSCPVCRQPVLDFVKSYDT